MCCLLGSLPHPNPHHTLAPARALLKAWHAEFSAHMVTAVPQLLSKYQDDASKVLAIAQLPALMNLSALAGEAKHIKSR